MKNNVLKENQDLVSVIVPIYNVEKYLEQCIQSIVNQTYDNLEIILVDDGSPDRCGEICDDWAKKDSRIRVFHQKNQGVSVARNVGIENMNGFYFTCIDPDDFWHTDYIKEMLIGANKTNADLVFCGLSNIDEAKKRNIPVIHRISDFQYMCPNALFYNEKTGVCEDCLHKRRLSCIKNKCVMNSRVLSAIKLGAKILHDFLGTTKKINAFVVPSEFTLKKLNEFGIPQKKLNHIPTFFNLKQTPDKITYEPYFLFVGRIEKQKGLQTLIDAFTNTDLKLKIIGFSNNGYEEELKKNLNGKQHHIEFLGQKTFEEIEQYLKTCLCTIVPSEWYDNFPNTILESFAYKK